MYNLWSFKVELVLFSFEGSYRFLKDRSLKTEQHEDITERSKTKVEDNTEKTVINSSL